MTEVYLCDNCGKSTPPLHGCDPVGTWIVVRGGGNCELRVGTGNKLGDYTFVQLPLTGKSFCCMACLLQWVWTQGYGKDHAKDYENQIRADERQKVCDEFGILTGDDAKRFHEYMNSDEPLPFNDHGLLKEAMERAAKEQKEMKNHGN